MGMKRPVSSNWKALAPRIKNGEKAAASNEATVVSSVGVGVESKELWFEVDEQTLQRSNVERQVAEASQSGRNPVSVLDLFPKGAAHLTEVGKYIAMDCEMVGVGPDGVESALARVSLVNYHGQVIFDEYVRPKEKVTDYRTHVSGIEPQHLVKASSFTSVQQTVYELLQGKILVGHSLKNDFRVLLLEHPKKMTRDTSKYRPFRKISRGKNPSLKRLAKEFLGIDIQSGSHDSVDDARVAMLLFRAHKDNWENYLFRNEGKAIKQKKRLLKKMSPPEPATLACLTC